MIVNICTRIDADLNIAFKTSDYAAGDAEIEVYIFGSKVRRRIP
ncbi:hypothetical protein [Microcoleus sp. CAWBG24]|nr:hypothetical protein [Microcoleus sp. CAWBG24]